MLFYIVNQKLIEDLILLRSTIIFFVLFLNTNLSLSQHDSIILQSELKPYQGILLGASSPSFNINGCSTSLVALSSFELHYFLNLHLGMDFDFQPGIRIRGSSFRFTGFENHTVNIDLVQINQFGFENIESLHTFSNSYETVTYRIAYRIDSNTQGSSNYKSDCELF